MTEERHANPPDPYRELFERSADAILIIEGDRFVDCNQATVDMLRYETKEQLLKTHPSELSPPRQPDGRESFEKANDNMLIAFERGSHRFEWEHLRADGEVFPVEVLLTAVDYGDRKILHVVWRDISERKLLEDQLRHAQKMEAIGRLAGGIAHDFNNLLVAVIGNSELLVDRLEDDADLQELALQIRDAGRRGADFVRQLMSFSRGHESPISTVQLDHALADSERLLRRLIDEKYELITRSSPDRVHVRTGKSQIDQILINLVTNARDAMPEGGTITVEMRRIDIGEQMIGLEGKLKSGPHVAIFVSDNGKGMDQKTARRAFEPFFTTKPEGQGTGLGLATVYGIAKQSGGAATIYSAEGRGTSVRVFLPIFDEGEEHSAGTDEDEEVRGGTETILVAEDEGAVRRLVTRVLDGVGYTVIEAKNGAEALELCREHEGEIDLILTDVIMPLMTGPEFVCRFVERGQNPRVLFASGYTDSALAALDDASCGLPVDLLEKPFSPTQLLRRVRAALDRERPDISSN